MQSTTDDMSHDRLSPSKSARVLRCAAAPSREAPFPDVVGDSAKAGTNGHWLAEHAFADATWPPMIMKQGMPMVQAQCPEPEVELTSAMIENVRLYVEYCWGRVKEMKPAVLRAELKVDPQPYTGRSDSKGSADSLIVSDPILEVVDLKTGGMEVEPDSSQLKLYGLGAMAEYMDPLSGLAPFPIIRLTIFQPARPGMDSIERSQDFTQQELIDWAVNVWKPAADATDDPNAPATPSDEGCKYCKAAKNGACPEYKAFVDQAATMLFQPIEGKAVEVVDQFAVQFRADALSNEQIASFMEAWPLIKARAADITEEGEKRLLHRIEIPGFKLVYGRGSRAWALEDDEQAKKFRNMKLRKVDIFQEKLRSPSQLLGLPLPTKTKELIKKHVINKTGSLTAVSVSDKRADAVPTVEFQPIKQEQPQEQPQEAPAIDLSFLSI